MCAPFGSQIDLFGEIAGTSFSPDGGRLFVAIADLTYSSLLEYHLSDSLRCAIELGARGQRPRKLSCSSEAVLGTDCDVGI